MKSWPGDAKIARPHSPDFDAGRRRAGAHQYGRAGLPLFGLTSRTAAKNKSPRLADQARALSETFRRYIRGLTSAHPRTS